MKKTAHVETRIVRFDVYSLFQVASGVFGRLVETHEVWCSLVLLPRISTIKLTYLTCQSLFLAGQAFFGEVFLVLRNDS